VKPINATGEETMFFLVETQHKPSKSQRIVFLPGLTLKTLQLQYALYVSVRASFITHNQLLLKVKGSRYRPGIVQRVGRDIALLVRDRGTRRG
jgi:hypothetical protein